MSSGSVLSVPSGKSYFGVRLKSVGQAFLDLRFYLARSFGERVRGLAGEAGALVALVL